MVRPGLAALPELLEVLSPLESIPDRVGVARAVARRVAATVAADCVIPWWKTGTPKNCPCAATQDRFPRRPWSLAWWRPRPRRRGRPLPGAGVGGLATRRGQRCFGALSILIDCPPERLGRDQLRDLGRVGTALARVVGEARLYERPNEVSQAL